MMAESRTADIERELLDEPHVGGRRISVRTVHDRVEGRGLDPRTVAERLDLDIAEVYRALAYYYDHLDEMQHIADDRDASLTAVREEAEARRPRDVDPPTG